MTTLINGRKTADRVKAGVAEQVAALRAVGEPPGLATILVGSDPASAVYVAAKRRAVRQAGMRDLHTHLPQDTTHDQVAAVIDTLAADPAASGILLQLPLPAPLDAAPLIERIPLDKDVDGLTTGSTGLLSQGEDGLVPCTPGGIVELLDAEGVELRGARVAVVGWGQLVGRPLTSLLLHRGATVTVAHAHTTDLAAVTRPADIVVVATGVPALIGPEHISPGTTVIDVGIHRTPHGLTGDVRATELHGIAARITPVPGGVGPMTIAMLLTNTLKAAIRQARREPVPT
ncbi:bifunctional 5,10-methylenetetrahydrofolate dehydrogenase/5,10-methenyltetrahydrofolate cyclohydrolase [Streptomyces sp. NPDC050560]|uniref:bifunctional 5,10-methylenetetrahydrofolate dehydrogenase/5,10-methenyltetrahydrofolate cyclohydrolase n=1 Tax=Streptomyces sp. NPDC050560 TaxID=3365630 RepID=UPI00379F58C6